MVRLAVMVLVFALAALVAGCGGAGFFGGQDCVSYDEYARAVEAARVDNEARYDEALAGAGLERVELPRPEYGQAAAGDLEGWTVRDTESGGHELVGSGPQRLARDAAGRYHAVDWRAAPLTERTLTQCGCDPGRGIEQRDPGPPLYRVPLTDPSQFAGPITLRTPIARITHRWEHEDGPPEMGCHMAP